MRMKKLTADKGILRRDGYLTTAEIAEYGHVSRQAIYSAIRAGKLKYQKVGKVMYVLKADYDEYRLNRYSGLYRAHEGRKLVDFEAGQYTIQVASKILAQLTGERFPPHRVYNLIYAGDLRAYRLGIAWIVMREDIERYIKVGKMGVDNQLKLITHQA